MINKWIDLKILPDGWVSTRFGDVSYRITKGSTPTSYGFAYKDEGIKFIKTENINKDGRINTISTFIDDEANNFLNRSKLKENDLLFSIAGTIGRVGIVKEEHLPANTNQALAIIRCPWKYIDNKYLFHFLQAPTIQSIANKKKVGVGRANISLTDISEFPLYLPPYPEQHRIVSKIEELFTKLDAGVDSLIKTKALLNKYRQSVLKSAFEGKLTEEWRRINPYTKEYTEHFLKDIEEFNNKKKDKDLPRRLPPINLSDLPSLPSGWYWIEAHKICQSVRDGTHDTPKYVEQGIPLVTSKNLKNGKIDFSSISLISENDHKLIQQRSGVGMGDILYAMIGTIGNPVIVGEDNQFSIKNVGLFKKNSKFILPKYLKYWLDSWLHIKILEKKDLIRGTTQKFISLGGLRVLPVPICSVDEQKMIIKEIEFQLSLCDSIKENIELNLLRTHNLHRGILTKAFQGKLVPQDPTDEPASKLLERVKAEKEKVQQGQKKTKKTTGKTRKKIRK